MKTKEQIEEQQRLRIRQAKLMRDNTKAQLAQRLIELEQFVGAVEVQENGVKTVQLPKPLKIRRSKGRFYADPWSSVSVDVGTAPEHLNGGIERCAVELATWIELKNMLTTTSKRAREKLEAKLIEIVKDNPSPEELSVRLINNGYIEPIDEMITTTGWY